MIPTTRAASSVNAALGQEMMPPASAGERNCQLDRCVAGGRCQKIVATTAATARDQSQAAVAIRFAATGLDTTAQYAMARPRSTPITAYPPAIVWGEKVSVRTAARAGSAISATVSRAPTAADAASAKRQGPPVPRPSRPAMTAPNTVALAAIQVAQPRLPSQTLSSAGTAGHTTTPRP